jgi:altronate dehydratase small subunit
MTTTDTQASGSPLRALVIHGDDNVANLIGAGGRGQAVRCTVEGESATEMIELVDDLPSNHKLARRDIAAREEILKYGLSIGVASRAIRRGEHVHTHNIESNRGRGDLQSV